jgi:hypothetical protein
MFSAAVRKAVMRAVSKQDPRRRLEAIADRLVEEAMRGDMSAVVEVGNRLDGRSKQQLEIATDNRMTIVIAAGGDYPRITVNQDGGSGGEVEHQGQGQGQITDQCRDIDTEMDAEILPPAPYETK